MCCNFNACQIRQSIRIVGRVGRKAESWMEIPCVEVMRESFQDILRECTFSSVKLCLRVLVKV